VKAIRGLALIAVLLALACIFLAAAWRREHLRAECWRATAVDDQVQPEGDCDK